MAPINPSAKLPENLIEYWNNHADSHAIRVCQEMHGLVKMLENNRGILGDETTSFGQFLEQPTLSSFAFRPFEEGTQAKSLVEKRLVELGQAVRRKNLLLNGKFTAIQDKIKKVLGLLRKDPVRPEQTGRRDIARQPDDEKSHSPVSENAITMCLEKHFRSLALAFHCYLETLETMTTEENKPSIKNLENRVFCYINDQVGLFIRRKIKGKIPKNHTQLAIEQLAKMITLSCAISPACGNLESARKIVNFTDSLTTGNISQATKDPQQYGKRLAWLVMESYKIFCGKARLDVQKVIEIFRSQEFSSDAESLIENYCNPLLFCFPFCNSDDLAAITMTLLRFYLKQYHKTEMLKHAPYKIFVGLLERLPKNFCSEFSRNTRNALCAVERAVHSHSGLTERLYNVCVECAQAMSQPITTAIQQGKKPSPPPNILHLKKPDKTIGDVGYAHRLITNLEKIKDVVKKVLYQLIQGQAITIWESIEQTLPLPKEFYKTALTGKVDPYLLAFACCSLHSWAGNFPSIDFLCLITDCSKALKEKDITLPRKCIREIFQVVFDVSCSDYSELVILAERANFFVQTLAGLGKGAQCNLPESAKRMKLNEKEYCKRYLEAKKKATLIEKLGQRNKYPGSLYTKWQEKQKTRQNDLKNRTSS